MNSRYLFRGKALGFESCREWVIGYLRKDNNNNYDIDGDIVDIDTVGQCTGLYDKNGILIFEGDIVKIGYLVYKVIWGYAQYKFEIISDKDCCFPYFYSNAPKCEVIGNIHDNPELLEENNDIL